MRFIIVGLMLFGLTTIEAKESQSLKIDMKECKALGNELRKELNELFKSETLLTEDEILPDSYKGQTFDGTHLASSPLSRELEKIIEESRAEDIDETEDFLQMSAQVIDDIDNEGNLPEIAHEYREETCEESFAKVHRIKEVRSVEVIPAVKETKLVCPSHTATLTASFNTKKSIEELQKKIAKHTGANIEIQGQQVNGRNVIVSYKHKDPSVKEANSANRIHTHKQGCFGAKTETLTLKDEEEKITWNVENPELETNLKAAEGCHLMDQSYADPDTRYQVWHCEAGDNQKCQSIRDAGGILKEKECLLEDQEGNCLKYLKTFSFESRKPIEQGYFLDDQELFNLEDFETESEADGFFGWVLSKLASVFGAAMDAGQDMQQPNPMKSEVFPGEIMKCKKGCSASLMFDCCSNPRGFLTHLHGMAGVHCTADEVKLKEKRKEKKCHYIGTERHAGGIYDEQVYICYGDIISREIQEGAHKQLGIDWGTAKDPNKKGVILEQLLGLDFSRIDFSDFEVEIKKKTDAQIPDIQKKIQATVDSLTPEAAKSQTENLLKEDMRKCFD